jgi:hypothetical protein
MHDTVLILHSWVRWIAIVTGLIATVAALQDNSGRAARGGLPKLFTIVLDAQFLLGILLLLTSNAFSNMGETMRDATARFYAVEHPVMMLVAIAFAHMGRVFARKASTPASARTKAVVFYGIATLLLLAGTPWPGTHDNRPLFRL